MAGVTTHWFTKGAKNLVEQEIGWVAGPANVALLQSGFFIDQDLYETWAGLLAAETSGTGYVAGGASLPNRSVVVDPATNEIRLRGDPVQWANSSIVAGGAAIYVVGGNGPLLGYIDFGTARASDNGLFRIEWPDPWVLRTRAM